jgi:hypothetical protein
MSANTNFEMRVVSRGVAASLGMLFLAAPAIGAQMTATAASVSDAYQLLGVSVAASGGPRDTLGLLVATVARNSPADMAGITPGNRILTVNGRTVRLTPNDIGRRAAADSAVVSFERAVRATPPGADVALRVTGGGRTRDIPVPLPGRQVPTSSSAAAPAASTVEGAGPPAQMAAPTPAPPAAIGGGQAATEPSASTALPPQISEKNSGAGASAGRSVSAVLVSLAESESDLRRLSRDAQPGAARDSLLELEHDLAVLRTRLRRVSVSPVVSLAVDSAAPRAALPSAPASPPMTSPMPNGTPAASPAPSPALSPAPAPVVGGRHVIINGLELTAVGPELAAYLGASADSALMVVQASDAWEPIRTGDVILQIDGARPDIARLRGTIDAARTVSVLLLRKGRTFTVSFGRAREQ